MQGGGPARTRVLIRERCETQRMIYSMALEDCGGMEIVAAVETWGELLHAAETHDADVLITGIHSRSEEALRTIQSVIDLCPRLAVLFVTGYSDPGTLRYAMRVRPHGYLCKPFRLEPLLTAVRTVAAGGTWFDSRLETVADG